MAPAHKVSIDWPAMVLELRSGFETTALLIEKDRRQPLHLVAASSGGCRNIGSVCWV